MGALTALLVVVLAGCGAPTQNATSDAGHSTKGALDWEWKYTGTAKMKVLATTGMIGDIVRNIGGERVEVVTLMGPGVDPHLYKATPGDVSKLTDADAVFYNGLHLEGKMTEILERLGDGKPSVAVASQIPKTELLQSDSTTDSPDPHVWFDVKQWIVASKTVRDTLKKFDAANANEYDTRAAAYEKKLRVLDTYAKTQLATVPKERRVLVTAHDAFRYLGRAYDVEVQGLQGISTASEVSLRDVQRIVNQLTTRRIKAIFVESSVSSRSIEAVVQGCRSKGHNVRIGGSLYSDAMGKSGTPQGTYEGMVRHNVDTIVAALK
jgi:manganese/zinc/iron transport system substrate-binding protein